MKKIISFCGSYIFAIILMIMLGIILAIGTFYESRLGADAAQQLIYKTKWFIGILGLLFLNVLFSTLKRWPFKRHHTGFVITHAGLLLLLGGSMTSKLLGIEGELVLREKESAAAFDTRMEEISIHHQNHIYSFKKRFTEKLNKTPWVAEIPDSHVELIVDQYFENSTNENVYIPGGKEEFPVISFSLANAMTSVEDELVLHGKNHVDLGPAVIRFQELRSKKDVKNLFLESKEAPSLPSATLKILIPEMNLNHDYLVQEYLGKETLISGTDLSLKITAFYSHAVVQDGKLINKSSEFINPAVEFEIMGPLGNERHLAFSQYPEYNTMHSKGSRKYDFNSTLLCDTQDRQAGNILTLFLGPQNKLYYKLQNSSGSIRTGRLSVNDPIQTGWMGLEFKVRHFISNAILSSRVSPSEKHGDGNLPALRLKIINSQRHETDRIWIQRGNRKTLHLDGEHIEIAYQYQIIPLGFKLELVDFILGFYPGSNQPMNFESNVKLIDPSAGPDRDHRIYMNHPLNYRGFKLFQSSYVKGENNESDISVFSVNHDPGIYLIYGGSIVMILGIYMLFFTSAFKKNQMAQKIAAVFCMMVLLPFSQAISDESELNYSHYEKIAIQNGGRIKPLQTFANETIKFITGKEKFEEKSAVENLLFLAINPREAIEHPIIRVTFRPLMEDVKLDLKRKTFSFKELSQNENLRHLIEKTIQKQMERQELNPYERKIATLYQQLQLLHDVISGDAYTILPGGQDKKDWLSVTQADQLEPKSAQEFKQIFQKVGLSFQKKDAISFEQSTQEFAQFLRYLSGSNYPTESSMNREIFYNESAPFQKAWIFYFLAFVLSLFVSSKGKGLIYLLPFIAGFAFHTLGILLRVIISGRAPVSNMYESLIFLVWGICFFTLILHWVYRTKVLSSVAAFLGFSLLVIAQSVPIDSAITQLVPVLRSNLWLTIHVLTIMLSYSAFALAMGIGHYNLGLYFLSPEKKEAFHRTAAFIYKTIQIGVMFLIAGTILGGVWANESWGRFWGWDPKETWALISILGYLAIIHARYAGWIGNFGMSILSIAGFALILMTYYGVNFVLAAGLHSYGFGQGGMPYVIAYIVFETAVVLLSIMRRPKA